MADANCEHCHGTRKCEACKGTGWTPTGDIDREDECGACGGDGVCQECGGEE